LSTTPAFLYTGTADVEKNMMFSAALFPKAFTASELAQALKEKWFSWEQHWDIAGTLFPKRKGARKIAGLGRLSLTLAPSQESAGTIENVLFAPATAQDQFYWEIGGKPTLKSAAK